MKALSASMMMVLAAPLWVCATESTSPREYDAAFERYIALGDELSLLLEKAQDRRSAETLAGELQGVLLRVDESRLEMRSITNLTETQSRHIREKYEKRMRTSWGKVYDQIYRLQKSRCYDSVALLKPFSILCSFLEK